MPVPVSAKQYGFLQRIAHGLPVRKKTNLTPEQAHAGIMEASPEMRSRYAKVISRKRRKL